MIVLDLPVPTSLNALFSNVSPLQRAAAAARGKTLPGRLKTKEYKSWLKEAGWLTLAARQAPLMGAVEVTYTLPDKGSFDLGNTEKATSDLLVRHGLIENDSRKIIRKITLEWSTKITLMRVTVQPYLGEK